MKARGAGRVKGWGGRRSEGDDGEGGRGAGWDGWDRWDPDRAWQWVAGVGRSRGWDGTSQLVGRWFLAGYSSREASRFPGPISPIGPLRPSGPICAQPPASARLSAQFSADMYAVQWSFHAHVSVFCIAAYDLTSRLICDISGLHRIPFPMQVHGFVLAEVHGLFLFRSGFFSPLSRAPHQPESVGQAA
jgi:hypothetical protein